MFSIKFLFLLLLILINIRQFNSIQINSSFKYIENNFTNDNLTIQMFGNVSNNIIQVNTFNKNHSSKTSEKLMNRTKEYPLELQYEASWTFHGREEIRAIFSLFTLFKSFDQEKFSNFNQRKHSIIMISFPSRSFHSIHLLKYYLFTIRQHKTNTIEILQMYPLISKYSLIEKENYFFNSLLLIRLDPKEKYSVCIYYYQTNISISIPDLCICQDIIQDHLEHPVHGLFFILTQYSIILGILIILQGLFSMRKRRITQMIHQNFINKTERIRSTLSSVSLIRQSFSSMDAPIEHTQQQQQHHSKINEDNQLKTRFTSSPAIILNQTVTHEQEPFLKLINNKNHVHFFFGADEPSDDNESNDANFEPYSDRPDALSSMAHILESNKPWSKHTH